MLRGAVGLNAIIDAGVGVAGSTHPVPAAVICAVVALACGTLLLAGFLTPVAGILLGGGRICLAFVPAPFSGAGVDDGWMGAFEMAVTAALVLLGPGRFSLDAYLFGRREILIPPGARA
jgi:uncharacterized membrane protein YphA (DoxX/SURF4 family)